MVLVDSSVWIDFFRGLETHQTDALKILLGQGRVAIGDLVLAEVMQGVTGGDAAFRRTLALLERLDPVVVSDHATAIVAARNYRHLRSRGITVRKTVDTLIATRCILDGIPLLYSDRDFDPFVDHLGLVPAHRLA